MLSWAALDWIIQLHLWWYRYEFPDTHNTHAHTQLYVHATLLLHVRTTCAAGRLLAAAPNRVTHWHHYAVPTKELVVFPAVVGWKYDHLHIHTATGGCDCSSKDLLMMGTMVPETCWAASMWLRNECYNWLLHLVGCFVWIHCYV
jgi:hypothetical protein